MSLDLLHELQERVKELTALHGTARVLQSRGELLPVLMREVVALLPPAWQYPEITVARIRFHGLNVQTPEP